MKLFILAISLNSSYLDCDAIYLTFRFILRVQAMNIVKIPCQYMLRKVFMQLYKLSWVIRYDYKWKYHKTKRKRNYLAPFYLPKVTSYITSLIVCILFSTSSKTTELALLDFIFNFKISIHLVRIFLLQSGFKIDWNEGGDSINKFYHYLFCKSLPGLLLYGDNNFTVMDIILRFTPLKPKYQYIDNINIF